jgi:hypothetical protein
VQAVRAVPRGSRSRGGVAPAQGDGRGPAEHEPARVADVSARAALEGEARWTDFTFRLGLIARSPAAPSRSSDAAAHADERAAASAAGSRSTAIFPRRVPGVRVERVTLSDGVSCAWRNRVAARAGVLLVHGWGARSTCGATGSRRSPTRVPRGRARPARPRAVGQADDEGRYRSRRSSATCAR